MPIYAYKCASCGLQQDVLQKMSDAPLTVCPQCGQASFAKQVTAAGFQLKGSGWYVTDFRDNGSKKDSKPADKATDTPTEKAAEAKTDTKTDSKTDSTSSSSTTTSTTASTASSGSQPSP
jgi:putative FmdB family regulatory protein